MANARKIIRFNKRHVISLRDFTIKSEKYYGTFVVKRFFFPFSDEIFTNIPASGLNVEVHNIDNPAIATIDLQRRRPYQRIIYGVLTPQAIQQLMEVVHDGRLTDGLVLSLGKSLGEYIILLDLYILRNGIKVIISGDGPGGENLTPTGIPPGR